MYAIYIIQTQEMIIKPDIYTFHFVAGALRETGRLEQCRETRLLGK